MWVLIYLIGVISMFSIVIHTEAKVYGQLTIRDVLLSLMLSLGWPLSSFWFLVRYIEDHSEK